LTSGGKMDLQLSLSNILILDEDDRMMGHGIRMICLAKSRTLLPKEKHPPIPFSATHATKIRSLALKFLNKNL